MKEEMEKNILKILRKKEEINNQLLEEIIKDRIKYKYENYFYIEEIAKWSFKFNISIENMLLLVLKVDRITYQKILKRDIIRIKSMQYNKIKNNILQKKKTEYMKKINLNVRTYFNKNQIIEEAKRLKINEIDFVINILGKNRSLMRRVMKDDKGKVRLYIGKYVNCALPIPYYQNNYSKIHIIIIRTINKIYRIFGISYDKNNYEDMIQSSNVYLMENGNGLDKHNKPMIKKETTKFRKQDEKDLYNKNFYFLMNSVKLYKRDNIQYQDNIRIKEPQLISENIEEEDAFSEIFQNEQERKIFRKFLKYSDDENKFEIIAREENMNIDVLKKLFEEKQKILFKK